MQPIVIRFGRLGDTLLLAPLLHRLHRGYGEPCLLLGTGPWTSRLYRAHPDVAATLEVTARHRPLALSPQRWRMLRALRRHRDAPVHVCEPEPNALAKIRWMLALAGVAKERCVFLTDTPERAREHWVDRLLRGCGQPPPAYAGVWQPPATPDAGASRLFLDAVDRRDRDDWLAARGWRGEPIWLIQPANKRSVRWNGPRDPGDDDKAWPEPRWIALLRAVRGFHPDAHIVLCGAPHEAAWLGSIAAGACNVDVAARELPLRRLMALAEIAQGMVSVDTGPAHVAAAMGCPLVVLFGAQPTSQWLPRSPTGSAVIALGGPPQRNRVDQITLDEVIAAWRGMPLRSSMIAASSSDPVPMLQ